VPCEPEQEIYKNKGDETDVANYRPTGTLAKIIEKWGVHVKLMLATWVPELETQLYFNIIIFKYFHTPILTDLS
jgi:hypothetical protein